MRLEIVEPQSGLRSGVEQMVRDTYRREYGAESPSFPYLLLAVLDDNGLPHCAAGLRDHPRGFFSEQYLDQTAEVLIASRTGLPVARDTVVELGPLAASRPGALLALLIGFTELGLGSGFRWGIFTATGRLRRLAARLEIPLIDLGAADASCVVNPSGWGTYYDHDPRVCAVDGLAATQRLVVSRLPCGAATRQAGASA